MRNDTASIEQNLVLSAAAHVLLFGCALAFAHYGGGPFRADRSVITVSLVSEKGGVKTKASERQPKAEEINSIRTEPDRGKAAVPATTEIPHHVWPVSEGTWQGQQEQAQNREGTSREGSGKVTQGDDSSAGQRSGYSSAEWQLLQTSLERVKTYPRLARERGIEGTVLVRFRADPSGSIKQVDVVKSSGARILDEASVDTIFRAAPVPYVDGWIEVPMVYQLKPAEKK